MLKHINTTQYLTHTPLASVWREGDFIFIYANEDFNKNLNEENVHKHFDLIEEMTMGQKLPFVVDFSKIQPGLVDHKLRKIINDRYCKLSSCTSFYTRNFKVQFFTHLYFKLAPTRVPMKIFSSMDKAVAWASKEHHQQTFSWSL